MHSVTLGIRYFGVRGFVKSNFRCQGKVEMSRMVKKLQGTVSKVGAIDSLPFWRKRLFSCRMFDTVPDTVLAGSIECRWERSTGDSDQGNRDQLIKPILTLYTNLGTDPALRKHRTHFDAATLAICTSSGAIKTSS